MRYIRYCYSNGYAGCDECGVEEYADEVTNDEIEDDLQDGLYSYAEQYEYCAEGYDWNTGWDDEADQEYYYENCGYEWEEITKEEYEEELGLS